MELKEFLPLNTKEKVDQLISYLKSSEILLESNQIEIDILMEIRRLKIQVYFKECFQILKNIKGPDARTHAKSQSNNKPRAVRKTIAINHDVLGFNRVLINQSIQQVEEFLELSPTSLIRVLAKSGHSVGIDTIFTEEMLWSAHDFITNYRKVKERESKLKTIEEQKLSIGFNKREQMFKPSRGQEGNYFKLIYIKPKS